ncbi:regulatory protein, luxR family [Nocardioides alpinus]|uniref:Regulatory protein, luxR family n=2 Tax=Nocardioides alpinus TaxID=748909 RepID=A0A1I0WEW3_9ACTN|nr:helix-turn-helix transcriptional regulator [Nocardioides alpinus]SFA86476.1 regulatory protein, luxR family [Nocardioides alpinus]
MPDLVLTEREQSCLRALMALEPTPGALPAPHVLALVDRLIPCDEIDVHIADSTGCVLEAVSLPHVPWGSFDPQACDGPLPLGIVHQSRDPDHQDLLRSVGVADGVVIGFRNGKDHVSQLSLDRHRSTFTDRDLAMLRMISPALQRLMRSHQTCALPSSLTLTERRVLQLVATGRSNSDIAEDLYVSVATVRKHLEHAYRKLGVHNRMAAVVAFRGGPTSAVDQVEEYA